MVGTGHTAYTERFHELAELVPRLVTSKSESIEGYIYELVLQNCGTVAATDPSTNQRAVLKASYLTGEVARNEKVPRSGKKRKETSNLSLST